MAGAALEVRVHVVHQAADGHDGDMGVALGKHGFGICPHRHVQASPEAGHVAGIAADQCRIGIDGADDLAAFLHQITQGDLPHLAAAILDDPYAFHDLLLR